MPGRSISPVPSAPTVCRESCPCGQSRNAPRGLCPARPGLPRSQEPPEPTVVSAGAPVRPWREAAAAESAGAADDGGQWPRSKTMADRGESVLTKPHRFACNNQSRAALKGGSRPVSIGNRPVDASKKLTGNPSKVCNVIYSRHSANGDLCREEIRRDLHHRG